MKRDLATTIIAAVIGIFTAYFITNLFLPEISNVSVKTLSGNNKYTLSTPSDDVFNYRAVNPTVEVYVGQCTEYNADGICIDDGTSSETEEIENVEDAENENVENEETENGTTD